MIMRVMSGLLNNVISFLSSEVGLWLVGAVIFGFLLRLFIQFLVGLFK
jgi:hypothetical protein